MDSLSKTESEPVLSPGYSSRGATLADLPAVHALYSAIERAEFGAVETALAEMRSAWEEPSVNLAEDARLVFDVTGKLVAEADVFRQGPARVWGYAAVSPGHLGRGLGTYLLAHIERRAHHWAAKQPPGKCVELREQISAGNRSARQLLATAGFASVRRMLRMEIELAEPPEPPQWPEGISVLALVPEQDERPVYEAMQEAFADHWGFVPLPFEEYAHWHFAGESFDPSLNFIATAGETVAGAILGQSRPDIGFVQTLGVRRAFRRSGLGMALLRQVFNAFYDRGQRRVGLEVDAQSPTGAVRLYERAGMRVAREWITYEKVIQPATSLGTSLDSPR